GGGPASRGGPGVPAGRPGAAGDDEPRGTDRRQPGEDAAKIDILLSQVTEWARVQLAANELTRLDDWGSTSCRGIEPGARSCLWPCPWPQAGPPPARSGSAPVRPPRTRPTRPRKKPSTRSAPPT